MRVAVIDIGSNSIKCLVVQRTPLNQFEILFTDLIETRISKGISKASPTINPDSIKQGVQSISMLWDRCKAIGKIDRIKVVATSAVRDATNANEFRSALKSKTGLEINILSGNEEAEGIARGASIDPSLNKIRKHFTLFDLGGGSTEFITFKNSLLLGRKSLPLGAVRLTERFIQNPHKPLGAETIREIDNCVRSEIDTLGFELLPTLVGMGGGVAILSLLAQKPIIERKELSALTRSVCNLPLTERISEMKVPSQRADIIPAAFVTFCSIVSRLKAEKIYFSKYNLRYGIADMLLKN